MEEPRKHIDMLRKRIEEIDVQIAIAIKNRCCIVEEIKEYKKIAENMVLDPYREEVLFSLIESESLLEKNFVRYIWREITSYSKNIQGLTCYILEDTLAMRSIVKMLLGASTNIKIYSVETILSNKDIVFVQSGFSMQEYIKEGFLFPCIEYSLFCGEEDTSEIYCVYTQKEYKECFFYAVYI